MSIRTDLAVEAHEMVMRDKSAVDGVKTEQSVHGTVKKTVVEITDSNGAEALGKPCGRYVTIEAPDLKYSVDDYEYVCDLLSSEIRAMLGDCGSVMVVGLGNRAITPDALGPCAADRLVITRHMKENMPEALDEDFGDLCAVIPGVMGTTGLETLEIIKGVAQKAKPEAVIAIDALAGADMSRICSTVQIADTGIAPGSGVGNHREGLDKDSLGVKVIAVGVPTVIAAEAVAGKDDTDEELAPLMVTTKDIDLVIERMSRTVANGINLAVHKNMTLKDIEGLVS